ncbi:MAG: very short patch repair endonuclease [Thermoplasmata archaeon]
MNDTISKETRSRVMAAVRSTGNSATELRMVAILRAHGITGWRRQQALPGRPDFGFPKERLAVFVDGCFWHGCPRHCRMPKTRRAYWVPKIARNRQRDREIGARLRGKGWKVCRVWEHALGSPDRVAERVRRLLSDDA